MGDSAALRTRRGRQWGIKKGSQAAALVASRALFLEAAAKPVFHAAGERTAGTLVAALTRCRRGSRTLTAAGKARTGDSKHHTAEHHDKTEHRQDRECSDHGGLKRHTGDQHRKSEHKQRRALQASSRRRGAQSAAADARGEFGVLGIERALDLVEHPLLMIGEWHSSLLAEILSRKYR